ncbi:hypothetical protein [Bradyrhizobium sp. USDA 4454]
MPSMPIGDMVLTVAVMTIAFRRGRGFCPPGNLLRGSAPAGRGAPVHNLEEACWRTWMSMVANLLAQKQQLLERLENDPGPNEPG